MKKYTVPRMEIVEFDAEDVIATSGCSCDNINAGGGSCYVVGPGICTYQTGDPD